MKLVINGCFGGFSLSPEAALRCYALGMTELATPVDKYFGEHDDGGDYGKSGQLAAWRKLKAAGDLSGVDAAWTTVFSDDEQFVLDVRPENRTHPVLVRVVEEMREKANGSCAKLRVIEIPDGMTGKSMSTTELSLCMRSTVHGIELSPGPAQSGGCSGAHRKVFARLGSYGYGPSVARKSNRGL
jgi:hypothetical protein